LFHSAVSSLTNSVKTGFPDDTDKVKGVQNYELPVSSKPDISADFLEALRQTKQAGNFGIGLAN